MKDFKLEIYRAMLSLEKLSPDLFFLLRKTEIKTDPLCPTAYAKIEKSGFKIVINDSWAESLDNFSLAGLIEHEILHILFNHLTEYNSIMPDKKTANIAMDLIINDCGSVISQREKLSPLLQNGCFLADFNAKFKTCFCSNKNTSLEIYNFLKEKSESEKSGLSESFDQGIIDENGSSSGEGNGENKPGQATLSDLLSPDEIDQILKSYGNKSADFKLAIEKMNKLEKSKQVRKVIESFLVSNKKDFKKSPKRFNKRFSFMPYGREKDKNQKILLGLDLSGSMISPEIINKMKIVISSAVAHGFSVDIIFGDTKKLGEFKDIKKNFDFSLLKGGGGTDLRFIFEQKISLYDGFIVFTDGFFDHQTIPKKLTSKMIFLLTEKNKINGFKTVEIL